MDHSATIVPVILSGGAGTRLWPLSRSLHPKQLLPVAAAGSMLQETASRVVGLAGYAAPLVVSGEEHRFLVAHQLAERGIVPEAIILEPEGRNTAAAIALAAGWLMKQGRGSQAMLVMPSDHVIAVPEAFLEAVAIALPAARAGRLVAFGIRPAHAETGYGYLELGEPLEDAKQVHSVLSFIEKPDAATAQAYVDGGRHLWNGGIFLFTVETYLRELRTHAPEVASACEAAVDASLIDGGFVRPEPATFATAPAISVDYALMERTGSAAVVPVDMQWSDVGSWDALWAISPRDRHGNALKGDVVSIDVHNSLVRVEDGAPMVAALGVQDLVIVSTKDAVLVSRRDASQSVKRIVDSLKEAGMQTHMLHAVVHRPWGSYETTDVGDRFQTKRIVVKPGQKLSLQMHHHRSEHWIVVSGTARVLVGDREVLLQENQSTYIPAGTTHRLENPGRIPLHLIEVQCGPYLGEDDIVRLEDNYGRV